MRHVLVGKHVWWRSPFNLGPLPGRVLAVSPWGVHLRLASGAVVVADPRNVVR